MGMKRKPYTYTFKNRKLKRLHTAWNEKKKYGKYILCGESGTGKTTFLNMVFADNENVKWYSYEDFVSEYLEVVRSRKTMKVPKEEVVIIENIEFLMERQTTLQVLCEFLNECSIGEDGKERLVICTSSDRRIAKKMKGFSVINVKPVSINSKIIKKIAADRALELSKMEIKHLAKCKDMIDFEAKVAFMKALKRENVTS